jgi:hypothetical protein
MQKKKSDWDLVVNGKKNQKWLSAKYSFNMFILLIIDRHINAITVTPHVINTLCRYI